MFNLKVKDSDVDGFVSDNMVTNALLFNFDDLSTRGNGYSNAIILTKTGLNTKVFELFNRDVLKLKFNAKIYWKTTLVLDGYVKVIEIFKNNFKIQVIGFKKDFYDSMDSKSLMELDLSDQDYLYTQDAYNTLKDSSDTLWEWCLLDGWNYADETTSVVNLIDSIQSIMIHCRPSANYTYLIDKIASTLGYQVDYSNISDLPHADLRIGSWADKFYFGGFNITESALSVTTNQYLALDQFDKDFFDSDYYLFDQGDDEVIIFHTFPTRLGVIVETNINCNIDISVKKSTELEYVVKESHFVERETTFNTDLIDFDYEGDETASVKISFDRDVTITNIRLFGLVIPEPIIQTRFDYYIPSSFNLPDWTQKELFIEFLKIYNLDFTIQSGVISFTKRNEIARANAIEMTKINEPSKSNFTDLTKDNNFVYSNDDSLQVTRYSFTHIVENELLENESVKLQSMFSSSEEIFSTNEAAALNYRVVNIPVYTYQGNQEGLTTRLYYAEDKTDIIADTGFENVERFAYFFHRLLGSINNNIPNLSMDFIFNNYYSENFNIQDDFLEYTYDVLINFYNYLQIIVNKVIYDSKEGRYLQVLEINKFNPNEKTEIKAIGIK